MYTTEEELGSNVWMHKPEVRSTGSSRQSFRKSENYLEAKFHFVELLTLPSLASLCYFE